MLRMTERKIRMDIRKIRSETRMGRPIYDLPLRVTFYARVSTDQDEQLNSLENQVQYYTELIKSKKNWTFVPGYIDEGISGTSTKKRDDFNRMIRDAKAGLFDFIITKEISRFSRSTLDSIKYTQELLDYNVGVLFQNDNINTLDTDSEFRLVIMAGVAQDEVRKLSERLKFGFKQAIKNGHVLGNDKLYGYDKKGCILTINEQEAEIVRIVFVLYANKRLGMRTIFKELEKLGYTSREGNLFNMLTIRHMLENPKYKGWYCGNKTQTLDYRTKKKAFLDETEWIMYPDPTIPAIVSEDLWNRANALYKERRKEVMELSFDGEINSVLVASVLDKVVVKKESTKQEIHLDIYLKLGQQFEAVYAPKKTSASIIRLRSIDARGSGKRRWGSGNKARSAPKGRPGFTDLYAENGGQKPKPAKARASSKTATTLRVVSRLP